MFTRPGLLDAVIDITRRAGREILDVYGKDFEARAKADNSPLTEADLRAHRLIVDSLGKLEPRLPVLSEESSAIDVATRLGWRRYWLVDPLDGTREFVKRNGEFTVNIALIEDGVATFGVIQAPVQDTLWWGDLAHGAYVRRDGGETALETRAPAVAPLRVAASRSHRDARTEAFMARMAADTGEIETIGVGSSLKFCRIADGAIDVYPRFGPTSEWDTAAGQAIVEAAGGRVLDPQGRPFRYNRRDTLLNGDFIALGDARLPWASWCA